MSDDVFDPKLDLVLDRTVDVPVGLVWKAWTEPERLMKWFCPLPWRTTACVIDLRPGGRFSSVMEGPNGERFDNHGCYLDVVPERRLTWTSALQSGFRPNVQPAGAFPFTARLTFEPKGAGTRYLVHALHADEPGRVAHEKMGFVDGWGKALDQLVAMCKKG